MLLLAFSFPQESVKQRLLQKSEGNCSNRAFRWIQEGISGWFFGALFPGNTRIKNSPPPPPRNPLQSFGAKINTAKVCKSTLHLWPFSFSEHCSLPNHYYLLHSGILGPSPCAFLQIEKDKTVRFASLGYKILRKVSLLLGQRHLDSGYHCTHHKGCLQLQQPPRVENPQTFPLENAICCIS